MVTNFEQATRGPIVLAIIDGWGLSPNWKGNVLSLAQTPTMDRLWRSYPHAVLYPYLPSSIEPTRPINSEISHATIGAGRDVRSDLEEISTAISDGFFDNNPILKDAFFVAHQSSSPIHLIGLASDARIHSDLDHLDALLKMAKQFGCRKVYLHLIADGHDVAPRSVLTYLDRIEKATKQRQVGRIASLIGRAYAMDRDARWERTRLAYQLWTNRAGQPVEDRQTAVQSAYDRGLSDEYLPPLWLDKEAKPIGDGDVVIVWNARADRLGQLAQAFIKPRTITTFFERLPKRKKLRKFVTLISPYLDDDLSIDIAFPPATLPATLAEIVSGRGLNQLRVAESEKILQITSFFNGGRSDPFPNEDHLIIPSPRSASFQQVPGTRTVAIVDSVIRKLDQKNYDLVCLNLASIDLVAHTRDLVATRQAITIVDNALLKLANAVLARNGKLLITADHGHAEAIFHDRAAHRDRAHTTNPVPFILVDRTREHNLLKQATISPQNSLAEIVQSRSTLSNIAPTILELLKIPIPVEMTGKSLLNMVE